MRTHTEPPEMADSDASKSPEEQPARTKATEVLRESRKFGQWFLSLRPDQLQSFALVGMTIFLCLVVGWILYRSDLTREKDKDRDQQMRDAMTRDCNSQFELLQQRFVSEREKDRVSLVQISKDLQAGQKDMLALILSNHTQEREKDRQHDMERDREHLKTIKEIRDAWAAFAVRMGDLERFLKKKEPEGPCELRNLLLRPTAPYPRPKYSTTTCP